MQKRPNGRYFRYLRKHDAFKLGHIFRLHGLPDLVNTHIDTKKNPLHKLPSEYKINN